MANIKDFILQPQEEEVTTTEEKEAPKPKKKKTVEYSIVAENEMDFVLQRKSPRITAIMAVIPSQGQYYITRTDHSKDGDTETQLPFDAQNIAWFTSKLDDPFVLNKDWINAIEKGKEFADQFKFFLGNKSELIKAGITEFGRTSSELNEMETIYKYSPKLCLFLRDIKKKVPKRASISTGYNRYSGYDFQPAACGAFGNMDYLLLFEEIFGFDSTKNWVNAFVDRDLNFGVNANIVYTLLNAFYMATTGSPILSYGRRGISYSPCERYEVNRFMLGNNKPYIEMKSFIEYCLSYQQEGYFSLNNFLQELADDWEMQGKLCGTIREKYPNNLASHHQRMCLKFAYASDQYNKEEFERRYQENKDLEWKNDEYIVKAPETAEEMADEAIAQSNCLRSYTSRVIDGSSKIYFLRKKKYPDQSLVTIEVSPEGRIRQVKAKFNREPRKNEFEAVTSWAKAKNLALA